MQIPQALLHLDKTPWLAEPPRLMGIPAGKCKQIFLLEVKTPHGDRCSNCGGAGSIYAFHSFSGGNQTPLSDIRIASKWINDSWHYGWAGAYACPVCNPDAMDHHPEFAPAAETDQVVYEDWSK